MQVRSRLRGALSGRPLAMLRFVDPRWALHRVRGPAGGSSDSDWDRAYDAADDLYGHQSSEREQARHGRLLQVLGPQELGRTLEVGCSVGVLSARLAPRCSELVACDISAVAVQRARDRLAEFPHVQVLQLALPQVPPGRFDTIVCPDVLYYLDRPSGRAAVQALARALTPGGRLLTAHWRPYTRTHQVSGDAAARLVARRSGLRRTYREIGAEQRIDCFAAPLADEAD